MKSPCIQCLGANFVDPLDIYAHITLFFAVYAAEQVIQNRSTGP